jgi:hypothetical protein
MKVITSKIKSGLIKTFILVSCLSFILPNTAFATANNGEEFKVQTLSVTDNNSILQKQQEIDKYVFETHTKDIEKKDFKVTHTSPDGEVVEVGINPFTDANADYLYSIFGKDKVRVVIGDQSVIMQTGVTTTSVDVKSTKEPAKSPTLLYLTAGVVLAGGALLIANKRRVK